ncbi:hypothetical protein BJ138DRAFT_1106789 [Hygrophoropsis aurantiaca]|uniref:Uncharacterized protein n=1 Tax=Hygrophoropsis aurantiaca TaxID=72124 RepID=A0ACB7ZTT4_9AGAM|nr:hypothetical protein BJ138DRAFT_1106789 [Hygrophoropsis aurantiaca]
MVLIILHHRARLCQSAPAPISVVINDAAPLGFRGLFGLTPRTNKVVAPARRRRQWLGEQRQSASTSIALEQVHKLHASSMLQQALKVRHRRIRAVRPWIERDVDDFMECPVDNMLQHLLYQCRDTSQPDIDKPTLLRQCLQAVLPLANGTSEAQHDIDPKQIKDDLINYVSTQGETDRYAPFATATNTVLACFNEIDIPGIKSAKFPDDRTSILFQRNDLRELQQDHQSRRSNPVKKKFTKPSMSYGVVEYKAPPKPFLTLDYLRELDRIAISQGEGPPRVDQPEAPPYSAGKTRGPRPASSSSRKVYSGEALRRGYLCSRYKNI